MVPPPNLKAIMPTMPLLKIPMTICESKEPGAKTHLDALFIVANN